MAECRRVFSDAKQSSPSGCKKLGKHGSRKRAVRRWALENDEKKQQNSHGLFQRKYAWNEKNLLKESSDSRHTVFYRYGADGQRAVKSSEQSETLYFNTMWSWIHNSSAYNTDREIKHIYLGSERLVTRTNGAGRAGNTGTADACTYYYHSDHLGSAHLITDYKGDEYERVEYTPYGEYWIEKRAPENRTLPFKFTGKERDEETGLYYYGARYLDAKTSRWLTTDPALGEYIPMAPVNDEAKKHNENLPGMGGIYNTVNFHLYHYAGIGQRSDSELQANNPVKYTDPDGCVDWDMVGKGVENLYKGFGKMKTGALILGGSGAVEALSAGTATPVVAVAGIIGGGFVANGFTQFVIGAAEVIGGLSAPEPDETSPVDDIPNTMNEIMATTIDSVVTATTGENCTKAKEIANFIDDNVDIPANTAVDILIQYQQPLNEPSPMDLRYILEDKN